MAVIYWQDVLTYAYILVSQRGTFDVFCSAAMIHCTDGGEIWRGGGPKPPKFGTTHVFW